LNDNLNKKADPTFIIAGQSAPADDSCLLFGMSREDMPCWIPGQARNDKAEIPATTTAVFRMHK